jgi:hypothetical protein
MTLFAAAGSTQDPALLGAWQPVAIGVASGIVSSIIASLIFLFVIGFLFRPNIAISSYISSVSGEDGKPAYQIKIINRSRFFGVHDLSINMFRVYSVDGRGNCKGINVTCDPVKLRTETLPNLPRKDNGPKALYALRITIEDTSFDPKAHTSQFGNYFLIEVSGRHSLSGIKRYFTNELHNSLDFLKAGEFGHGKDLNVVS